MGVESVQFFDFVFHKIGVVFAWVKGAEDLELYG